MDFTASNDGCVSHSSLQAKTDAADVSAPLKKETFSLSSSLVSLPALQEKTRALLQLLPGRHLLITGGCGFIGSCFIECCLQYGPADLQVYNLDTLEYCAGAHLPFTAPSVPSNAAPTEREGVAARLSQTDARYHFIQGSILDAPLILDVLRTHQIDLVVHMAAQTHVDNSFFDSLRFTQVNVVGTHTLLESARQYGGLVRFLHVSTDEVYGETVSLAGAATEANTVLQPTNPYAATKAAAEHLVSSYFHSFRLPVVISRGNNVYGPGQYPEKVIPRFIVECLAKRPLPIHGDGHHQRSFMYVEDVVRGLATVLVRGQLGEVYNVASTKEWSVNEVARRVVACVTASEAEAQRDDFDSVYVRHVEDRAYNDARYFISNDRLTALGWEQQVTFEEGLRRTVEWYRSHPLDSGYWTGSGK